MLTDNGFLANACAGLYNIAVTGGCIWLFFLTTVPLAAYHRFMGEWHDARPLRKVGYVLAWVVGGTFAVACWFAIPVLIDRRPF